MSVRVHLQSDRFATVHIAPSRWSRLFGAEDLDFEAHRIAELGGSHSWITHDNRPVSREVADELEAELTRACVGDRLKTLRT